MQPIESIRESDGWLHRYTHASDACHCTMTFSVYLPPEADTRPVPAVYFLSGLTCTDDNFRTKAGAQRYAAELGLALIIPDTSPRGDDVPDVPERYDLGQGAGFYINATQPPWATHYHMYDYIVTELPALVETQLPIRSDCRSITGHSMGGHGALMMALRNPGRYSSVSAFAPICNPVLCGWGQGCFGAYLGDDRSLWQAWDTVCLINGGAHLPPALVDQGTADEFLDEHLHPQSLIEACRKHGVPIEFNLRSGYDHSYHFIASYIGQHLAFHARYLNN